MNEVGLTTVRKTQNLIAKGVQGKLVLLPVLKDVSTAQPLYGLVVPCDLIYPRKKLNLIEIPPGI